MNYRYFGILIDCSCNGVMKVAQVKHLIDVMEKMGYNLLELCTDDTYKIEGEPYFGYLRGGYSKEEIKEMDAYAKAHGVELVPCIQTLAHFTNLVKLPHYADIVDVSNILLVDEPKTYELIEKMFSTLAECYTTRTVNIGMDEAHMLGLGKYLQRHGLVDRQELLLRHLRKVLEIANKYGFKPHMWSDMFFRLANRGEYEVKNGIPKEVMDKVPEEVGLSYWDYYSFDEAHYDEMFRAHKQFNREIWFAGGAWTWNSFAPNNLLSLKTMKPAIKQVRKHGIENVLITMWGDDGHDCSFFSVLPSLYAIRKYGDGIFDEKEIAEGFEKTFGIAFDDMMRLDLPNKTKFNPEMTETRNACKCLLYNDCFLGWKDHPLEKEMPIEYGAYAKELYELAKRGGEYAYLFENLANLCSVLEYKAELGVYTRRAYKAGDKESLRALLPKYEESARRVKIFHKSMKEIWMRDNKPFGWEVQEIRFGGLYSRILDCKERIEEYLDGKVENIPELEEEILPYADWGLQYNSYRGLVSVSTL